jgi:general secretion pathway protein G
MVRHAQRRWTGGRGFTLIELLITLAILAVLASSAASLLGVASQRARESELRADLRQLRDAIDAYKAAVDQGHIAHASDASGYPPDLASLVKGIPDIKSIKGSKLYFLRRLPRDPMADAATPANESWGLRSYKSDPKDPLPGDDVFDVRSLSPKRGLNGVPYDQW